MRLNNSPVYLIQHTGVNLAESSVARERGALQFRLARIFIAAPARKTKARGKRVRQDKRPSYINL